MLKFGEAYVILVKDDDGEFTLLNTFYPENRVYDDMKVQKLLQTVRHKQTQWYDTYYKDKHLVIAVATMNSQGDYPLVFRVI